MFAAILPSKSLYVIKLERDDEAKFSTRIGVAVPRKRREWRLQCFPTTQSTHQTASLDFQQAIGLNSHSLSVDLAIADQRGFLQFFVAYGSMLVRRRDAYIRSKDKDARCIAISVQIGNL
jgi:hypothetical protein